MAQRMNVLGERIDTSERWDNKGFIVESYDEFIRMCQLNQVSKISKRPISQLTFDAYMLECKQSCKINYDDMQMQFVRGLLTKEQKEFLQAICRKSEEAIVWYFGLDDKGRLEAVYPEAAPTEAAMKKRVEDQAEGEVIVNVPKPITPFKMENNGRTVKNTSELKVVKRGSLEHVTGSTVSDGLKDALTSKPTLYGPDGKKIN